jgi:cytochrome c
MDKNTSSRGFIVRRPGWSVHRDGLASTLAIAVVAGVLSGCTSSADAPSDAGTGASEPCLTCGLDGGSASQAQASSGPPLTPRGAPSSSDAVAFAVPAQPSFGPTVAADPSAPPISGGTLLVLRDGTTAVAADPDRDALYVVDTVHGRLSHTIALQAGDEPGRLVEDGAGRVHAALRGGGALVTVDPVAGAVITRRAVCAAPRGTAWDPATDNVWVACATGELVALPASGGAATPSLVLDRDERDLRDVLVEGDGSLAVTQFRSAKMLRLTPDGTITRTDGFTSPDPRFAPQVAWRTIPGPSPGSVFVVHQAESTLPVPTQSQGAYGSPFDPTSGVVVSVAELLDADGVSRSMFELVGVLPVDIALSPDQTSIAVAAPGNAFMSGANMSAVFHFRLDGTGPSFVPAVSPPETPSPPPPDVDADGAIPNGPGVIVASLPNFGASQAIAVAFDAAGDLLVQVREPAEIIVLGGTDDSVKTTIALATASRDDTGHDLFHTLAGALVACASCHPEGREDGHVWLLDGNPRRTPSLLGTIAGTAPYHWPGDEADMTALANDVYTRRMNGATLVSAQSGALQSWVESLPAPPPPAWVDPAAAQRGEALFVRSDVQCSTCHSGLKYTDNQTVDVGTGGAFQVPPLVGVGWRPPFLHDGCALTLAARFDPSSGCATPQHGSTSSLSSQDISDLVSYLQTL